MKRIPAHEFDLSAVQPLIHEHAISLFEQWQNAQSDDRVFLTEPPSAKALSLEFTQCFADALSALQDHDFAEKPSRWEHGFILGFVEGNISVSWRGRYLMLSDPAILKALWWKHALAHLTQDREALASIEHLLQADLDRFATSGVAEPLAQTPWKPADAEPSFPYWQAIKDSLFSDIKEAITSAVSDASSSSNQSSIKLPPSFSEIMPQLLSDNFLSRTSK